MNDLNMTGTGVKNAVPQDSANKETKTKTTATATGQYGKQELMTMQSGCLTDRKQCP